MNITINKSSVTENRVLKKLRNVHTAALPVLISLFVHSENGRLVTIKIDQLCFETGYSWGAVCDALKCLQDAEVVEGARFEKEGGKTYLLKDINKL